MEIFNQLTWIDWTSLAILAYFLIMGLFRGFLWQASRLASLVVAYVLAGLFAGTIAGSLEQKFTELQGRPAFYLAYFTIFIAVLIVLSVITILLDRFVRKLQLSFYNHLGGGVLGIATAAALIVGALGLVYKTMPTNDIVVLAKESYTGEMSRYLVRTVGLPEPIRDLYESTAAAQPGPANDRVDDSDKAKGSGK